MRKAITGVTFLMLISLLSFAHPTRADDATPPYDWKQLDLIFNARGELKDDVYTFTLPRKDLNVSIGGMDVPTAAGIASQFYFFQCSCGKMRVVGQFCCCDYETNDVIDAIRPGAMLEVSSIGAMFNDEKPRLSLVHFQGEGDAIAMAKLIKSGLGWMGEARSTTQPMR